MAIKTYATTVWEFFLLHWSRYMYHSEETSYLWKNFGKISAENIRCALIWDLKFDCKITLYGHLEERFKEEKIHLLIKIQIMKKLESINQSLISNYKFSVSYGHLSERLNNKINIIIYPLMQLSSKPIQEEKKKINFIKNQISE